MRRYLLAASLDLRERSSIAITVENQVTSDETIYKKLKELKQEEANVQVSIQGNLPLRIHSYC